MVVQHILHDRLLLVCFRNIHLVFPSLINVEASIFIGLMSVKYTYVDYHFR
jgi:hypothetical protein